MEPEHPVVHPRGRSACAPERPLAILKFIRQRESIFKMPDSRCDRLFHILTRTVPSAMPAADSADKHDERKMLVVSLKMPPRHWRERPCILTISSNQRGSMSGLMTSCDEPLGRPQ
jgi:hypothetical protein